MFDHIIDNLIGVRGSHPHKRVMHLNFNIYSNEKFYRKRENKWVWSINIYNRKTQGLRIEPFTDMDWDRLRECLKQRVELSTTHLNSLMVYLQNYIYVEPVL